MRRTVVIHVHQGVIFFLVSFFVGMVNEIPQEPKTKEITEISKSTHQNPVNLKVLPKNISGEELDKLMRRFTQDVGVPCGYCHEMNPQTKQINYSSDENPVKETARFMIKMTNDINTKYLSQLGDRRYAEPFTCGNCHQGLIQPAAFEPKEKRQP